MAAADDLGPGSRDEDREAERADREAIDRAFADLVAGYHLTAERPAPLAADHPEPSASAEPVGAGDPKDLTAPTKAGWADDHPLFRFEPPDPEPTANSVDPGDEREERYEPPDPEPLPKPAWPVLLAWIGMGYAVLTMLAVVAGARLPMWAGWLAILGFVGGFGLLVSRLPRERPPGSGDGAVV